MDDNIEFVRYNTIQTEMDAIHFGLDLPELLFLVPHALRTPDVVSLALNKPTGLLPYIPGDD